MWSLALSRTTAVLLFLIGLACRATRHGGRVCSASWLPLMGWVLILLVVRPSALRNDWLAFSRSAYSLALLPLGEPHPSGHGLLATAPLERVGQNRLILDKAQEQPVRRSPTCTGHRT